MLCDLWRLQKPPQPVAGTYLDYICCQKGQKVKVCGYLPLAPALACEPAYDSWGYPCVLRLEIVEWVKTHAGTMSVKGEVGLALQQTLAADATHGWWTVMKL